MTDWWEKPDMSPADRTKLYGTPGPSPSATLSGRNYDPVAHYNHVKKLLEEYRFTTEDECFEFATDVLKDTFEGRIPHDALLGVMVVVFCKIFEGEGWFQPTLLPPSQASYIRRHYTEVEKAITDKKAFEEALVVIMTFMRGFLGQLPDSVFQEPSPTKPKLFIASFLSREHVHDAAAMFCQAHERFPNLTKKLTDNIYRASGVDPNTDKPNPRLTYAHESDLPLELVVNTYLGNTPLLDLFIETLTFDIPEETRFSGHWIIAPTGRGKTNLLHSLVRNDLQKDASVILMDSKGELIGPIQEMAPLKDRLVIVEPDPDYPLALNPLDIPNTSGAKKLELLEYIVASLLGAEFTPLQKALLRNLLPAIIKCVPHPTLQILRDIVESGLGNYKQHFDKLLPLDKRFFDTQLMSSTYGETRKQLIWRIDLLMSNYMMRAMFNSPTTKFDLFRHMDAGKVIIINANKDTLGEEGAEFYQRFFIALILAAAQKKRSKPCYFYIDECHTAITRDERITTMLDECRSSRVATILAHQRLNQIHSKNVLSALKNCAIRQANADDDAPELEASFRIKSGVLRSMQVGQFATWTREMGNRPAIILDIPLIRHTADKLSAEEQQELREDMRREFCNPVTIYESWDDRDEPAPVTAEQAPASKVALKEMLWRKTE